MLTGAAFDFLPKLIGNPKPSMMNEVLKLVGVDKRL